MGLYPIEVAATDLYTTTSGTNSKKYKLGCRAIFDTINGPVEAVYVKNASASSLVQGLALHHGATPWVCNTTLYAATNATPPASGLVGILCASLPGSATEAYAWAAVRGPITAMNVKETVASSNHNGVLYAIQLGSANLMTVAATLDTSPTSFFLRGALVGIGGGATTTIATTGGAGPAFITLFWR